MTLVNIDLRNQGHETSPGDRVVFYSLLVREGDFGTISTAPVEVELTDGKASVDLAPGPVGVQIIAKQVADTRIKIGEVPPSGPTTLNAVMMVAPAYTPALQKMMVEAVERAKQTALEQVDAEVSVAINAEVGEAIYSASTAAQTAAAEASTARQAATSADARATAAEGKSDNAVSRVSALELMGGLAPGEPADGQTANLIEQSDTLTRKAAEKAAISASPRVDARSFGVWEVDATADASSILNAAAAEARAKKRPLFIPAGTLYIDSTVDLRRLDVYCEANIIVRHITAPGVIVGDTSAQRGSRTIIMRDVRHAGTTQYDWEWDHPALRVIGIKGSYVQVGAVSLMELFADGSVSADNSIAYNLFQTQRVNHLRLRGVNGTGWINQNLFLGGSFHRITLDGTYPHNANRWIMPSVEGRTDNKAMIDIQTGSANVIEDARTENGTQVRFGENTNYNVVSSLFSANEALIHDGFHTSLDQGVGNVVTTRSVQNHTAETLFSVSAATPLYGTASATPRTMEAHVIPSVGGGKLRTPAGGWWFDTGIIPIELARNPSARNLTLNPRSRMTRFVAYSDAHVIRPYVTVYDADRQVIPAGEVQSIASYGNWGTESDGSFSLGAPIDAAVILVKNPNVKFIKIRWFTGASVLFTHATLVGYLPLGNTNIIAEIARESLSRPLYATSKPTQGLAWPGTTVTSANGSWVSTDRRETTLAVEASTTELSLVDGAGISAGDVIGVLLDDGRTHWSTVVSRSGNAVTIAAPLPSPASAGRGVGTTRWSERISSPPASP